MFLNINSSFLKSITSFMQEKKYKQQLHIHSLERIKIKSWPFLSSYLKQLDYKFFSFRATAIKFFSQGIYVYVLVLREMVSRCLYQKHHNFHRYIVLILYLISQLKESDKKKPFLESLNVVCWQKFLIKSFQKNRGVFVVKIFAVRSHMLKLTFFPSQKHQCKVNVT